jgi:CRP-like cAMP-binding protein
MYLVLEGTLVVETGAAAPPRLVAGAVVGELALIDAAERAFTVRAVDDARLLRIDRAAFGAALDRWPDLGMGLLRTLAQRLR